ncbi:SMI1/KNR4 family protein [Actinosynnema pretiosum subsp. pretiosum]|uniref:SMI1/KNR4 family protein n=1 Tax=Actinosynnema pretiosum subsp. pretiosum TaxID=103721 RepID=A0AA45L5S8_9PSEU|nr:SMI1/KNR4 family protein [Actinosynnema pretiosum subsp. pretiosum]
MGPREANTNDNRFQSTARRADDRRTATVAPTALRGHLNPPASEAEVQAFEREQNVTLPQAYRRFLLELGDGGVGPHYGVLPLHEWSLGESEWPAQESPFDLGRNREEWWEGTWEDDDHPYRGTISVVHQGCANYTLLIVTGQCRGRLLDASLDASFAQVWGDEDFLAWYERWPAEVLAGRGRWG